MKRGEICSSVSIQRPGTSREARGPVLDDRIGERRVTPGTYQL